MWALKQEIQGVIKAGAGLEGSLGEQATTWAHLCSPTLSPARRVLALLFAYGCWHIWAHLGSAVQHFRARAHLLPLAAFLVVASAPFTQDLQQLLNREQGLAGMGSGSSLLYLLFLILQFCCCWRLDTGFTGPSSSLAQHET